MRSNYRRKAQQTKYLDGQSIGAMLIQKSVNVKTTKWRQKNVAI